MTPERYAEVREAVIAAGFVRDIDWAEGVDRPHGPQELWWEYSWVVLNSGMKNRIAAQIWERVRPVVEAGGSARSVFGHAGKAAAIDAFWANREQRFAELASLADDAAVLEWCVSLPWIGDITKWHLAKNLGADVAKPDRWLVRVAAAAGEDVHGLCRRLSRASGDRIATVDVVIWRACALGLHRPAEAD